MNDNKIYDGYSYSRTLKMLNCWYDRDTVNVNFAEVLLSMRNRTSIQGCMSVYEKVYWKFQNHNPDAPYKKPVEPTFMEDINNCLNENLLLLMSKQKDDVLTPEFAYKILANFRNVSNQNSQLNQWRDICRDKHVKICEDVVSSILDAQKQYDLKFKEFEKTNYPLFSNGYKKLVADIKTNLKTLKHYGFRKLPQDFEYNEDKVFRRNITILSICTAALFCGALYLLLAVGIARIEEITTKVFDFIYVFAQIGGAVLVLLFVAVFAQGGLRGLGR